MTKKEKELLDMMKIFKKLNSKDQGFIFGLAEGILICKRDSHYIDDANISKLANSYK